MKSETEIRRATLADLDRIVEIEQASFCADAFRRRQLAYLIVHAKGVFFVTVVNNQIQGYISLLERSRLGNLRIYSIAVAHEARGQGIGQALLDQAVAYANTRGLHEITLEVNTANMAAQNLYLKNGFIRTARLAQYYHDGSDGWRMKSKLTAETPSR